MTLKNQETIKCSDCGKEMVKKHSNHKRCVTCSSHVRWKYAPAKKVVSACINCGEVFEQTNKQDRICSENCRKKYKTMRSNEKWATSEKKSKPTTPIPKHFFLGNHAKSME